MRWRRPLLVWTSLAAVIAAGVTLGLTPRYFSQASILPPPENPSYGGLSALLQQYQVQVPGGTATPFLPTLYASIIRSHSMAVQVLDEFKLRPVLGGGKEQELIEALHKRTFLKYTDEGILLVGYEDTDRQRAADVTNAFVRHLDEFIQRANADRAGDTRTFIEKQVERCGRDLAQAEEKLRDFQLEHRAIEIDTQTQGTLEIAGEIQGKILAAELELGVLQEHALPTSPEVLRKQEELRVLRDRYRQMVGSEPTSARAPGTAAGPEDQLFPRFDEVPDLALRYMRLLREVKVQTTVYTTLLEQMAQAHVEEQKHTHVLTVLDWAVPSEIRVFPRRMRIVIVAALAAFVWVTIVAVCVEKLRERRESAAEAARLAALHDEWQRMPGWVRSLEKLMVK
jgi:tyrosine-protein kinase Etk/Wzc